MTPDKLDPELKKAYETAANHLQQLGMENAATGLRILATSNLAYFIDHAVQTQLDQERKAMALEFAIKRRLDALQLKMEYELALAMKGSGIGGYNSQGNYVIW